MHMTWEGLILPSLSSKWPKNDFQTQRASDIGDWARCTVGPVALWKFVFLGHPVWCNILSQIRDNFAICAISKCWQRIDPPSLQLSKCATYILFATFTTLQYIFAPYSLVRNFKNFATYCLHFWNLAQSVAYLLAQCPCCGCNVMGRWCLRWGLTSLSFDNITLSRKKQQHLHLVLNQECQHYEDV